jgi:hypothetical protein
MRWQYVERERAMPYIYIQIVKRVPPRGDREISFGNSARLGNHCAALGAALIGKPSSPDDRP